MNRHTTTGVLFSLLSLSTLMYFMMNGSNMSLLQWPYEAFQGLVFALVWGFGISVVAGYLTAIIFAMSVVIGSFLLGRKLSRYFG
ncbi:hypothetical protein [Vibrio sagamiensis]|nr:hypothetical protein [Vibrio sagamiensis]PNQ60910.1 hypothetical protein C1141_11650 [Vibrio agarivorans]